MDTEFFEKMNERAIILEPVWGEDKELIDFRIVACNASALVVLKRGEGNVIGQSLLQTFPNVLRYGVFEKYRKVFEGGAAEQFEAQYNRGDRVFWFRVNVFAYSKGLGVLFTDITDLIETREALKQTNRALERFSGTISHDLKAPVRRIVQYVDVLREEGAIVEPEHAEFFKVIQDNARHVSSLIDNLLAYTKARGPVHQARSFNIRLSVDRALHVLAGEIKDSGVRIIIPNDMPEVMGNEILLSQVFQNLISNAIRYNGTQSPEIRITSSRGKRYGEFSVIDNGPGIPAHETKAAFDFMVSLTEGKGGHGIGLAITKEIIERHFGSIWIDPFYKDGACFSFLLPLAPQA